jgi:hypothetical protein
MRANTRNIFLTALAMSPALSSAAGWSASLSSSNHNLLQFFYTTAGGSTSQYGVLDLRSGYVRFIYGPTAGWGTSVDVMPIFWSGGVLYQGYAVTAKTAVSGQTMIVTLSGTAHGLSSTVTLTLEQPEAAAMIAQVSAKTTGTVTLDTDRPHEAFKPAFLSSMRDSATVWDSQYPIVFTGYPTSGWIFGPTDGLFTDKMGLEGGTSSWKTNAPTIELILPSIQEVAGYVTADTNPNDDNVGFWIASNTVLSSWSYEIYCGP